MMKLHWNREHGRGMFDWRNKTTARRDGLFVVLFLLVMVIGVCYALLYAVVMKQNRQVRQTVWLLQNPDKMLGPDEDFIAAEQAWAIRYFLQEEGLLSDGQGSGRPDDVAKTTAKLEALKNQGWQQIKPRLYSRAVHGEPIAAVELPPPVIGFLNIMIRVTLFGWTLGAVASLGYLLIYEGFLNNLHPVSMLNWYWWRTYLWLSVVLPGTAIALVIGLVFYLGYGLYRVRCEIRDITSPDEEGQAA